MYPFSSTIPSYSIRVPGTAVQHTRYPVPVHQYPYPGTVYPYSTGYSIPVDYPYGYRVQYPVPVLYLLQQVPVVLPGIVLGSIFCGHFFAPSLWCSLYICI